VYCMTKAAISHLTKCLAIEWGKYNITVNAVAPTFIRTPGSEQALADPEFRADVIERIAGLHRIGEPMDVAGAIVFLASPAASLITGHRKSRWRNQISASWRFVILGFEVHRGWRRSKETRDYRGFSHNCFTSIWELSVHRN